MQQTPNYHLPLFEADDPTSWMSQDGFNGAMEKIDSAIAAQESQVPILESEIQDIKVQMTTLGVNIQDNANDIADANEKIDDNKATGDALTTELNKTNAKVQSLEVSQQSTMQNLTEFQNNQDTTNAALLSGINDTRGTAFSQDISNTKLAYGANTPAALQTGDNLLDLGKAARRNATDISNAVGRGTSIVNPDITLYNLAQAGATNQYNGLSSVQKNAEAITNLNPRVGLLETNTAIMRSDGLNGHNWDDTMNLWNLAQGGSNVPYEKNISVMKNHQDILLFSKHEYNQIWGSQTLGNPNYIYGYAYAEHTQSILTLCPGPTYNVKNYYSFNRPNASDGFHDRAYFLGYITMNYNLTYAKNVEGDFTKAIYTENYPCAVVPIQVTYTDGSRGIVWGFIQMFVVSTSQADIKAIMMFTDIDLQTVGFATIKGNGIIVQYISSWR